MDFLLSNLGGSCYGRKFYLARFGNHGILIISVPIKKYAAFSQTLTNSVLVNIFAYSLKLDTALCQGLRGALIDTLLAVQSSPLGVLS